MITRAGFVFCLAGVAGAVAADRPVPPTVLQLETAAGMSSVARPVAGGFPEIVAEYNFATGSLDIYHSSLPPHIIGVDPSLANLHVLSIEAIDITADVHHNVGANFENWASEMRLGLRIMENNLETTGGSSPFFGVNHGPTTGQGTFLEYTGGGYGPLDVSGQNWFTPASGFSVAGWSTYNDGTGLRAHTVTGGILRVTLVPAPGAGAVLAVAGALAMRRRRRR